MMGTEIEMHSKRSTHIYLILGFFFLSLISSVVIANIVKGALINEPEDYELKPGEVQHIKYGEIPPDDSNIIYRYTLNSSLKYHVFLSGPWVEDVNETERTDYDLYVYNPLGVVEVRRTEAAALPEHLGASSQDPFFSPKLDGLYTLKVVNDESESLGAQNATLMVIEHLDVDKWYRDKLDMKGKNSTGEDTFFTTWAYEFVSSKQLINIFVEVPELLDMYELRLFVMADRGDEDDDEDDIGYTISGALVPPWRYLRGSEDPSTNYGGYNMISKGYRGVEFTSTEDFGVDMVLEYDSGSDSEKLYYLVFIAEKGDGTIDFIIHTDQTSPELYAIDPIDEASANEFSEVSVYANDNESGIDRVILSYSVDDWQTSEDNIMAQLEPDIFITNIPGQAPGTKVDWNVTALDAVGNEASINGSYLIKLASEISVSATPEEVVGNIPISVSGTISPAIQDEEITIHYINENKELNKTVVTNEIGEYSDQFVPEASGTWEIQASWSGGDEYFSAENSAYVVVEPLTSSLMIFTETDKMSVGEDITISGTISPQVVGTQIVLLINYPEGSQSKQSSTNTMGEFTKNLTPESAGTWEVTAEWPGNLLVESSTSNTITFTVTRKGLNIYWIGGGLVIIVAAVVTFVVIRRRRGARARTESTEDEEEYLFE